MTCLAWDGKVLAADKRMTQAGLAVTVTKIFRIENSLVGISGTGALGLQMLEWFKCGANPAAFPNEQRTMEDWTLLVVINAEGVFEYQRSPFPIQIESSPWASGAGRDYALAAMHCGKTAREAVEIACKFDVSCGNGIDTLEL
jgi:ATP-dependent protease HslVU (ClpYQ) peptidase subunit